MPRNHVLIFAQDDDIHALAVKNEIERISSCTCVIINSEHFPSSLNISVNIDIKGSPRFMLQNKLFTASLDSVCGVWRRRIHYNNGFEDLDKVYNSVSKRDSRSALDGFFYVLADGNCFCINPPYSEAAFSNKLFQLNIAHKCGLSVPDTLVTNSSSEVESFFKRYVSEGKKLIYKAFHSPKDHVITTNLLNPEDLQRLDQLHYSPVIFQEYVEGKNLRLTYVNGEIFCAEVKVSVPEAERDWRIEMYNEIVPHTIPHAEEQKVLKFMKELKMLYGAFDFKINNDGKLVFLEVNPWGQYLFVEIQTGLPITNAIARSLISNAS